MIKQTQHIKKFSEYVLEQEEFNPLFLKEGVMVNFDRNTFNRTYGKTLNESADKKGTLERAYTAYELMMFANEKYHWFGNQILFEDSDKINVLEADKHNYLLMKGNEMFVMSKQTFDNIEHLTEGWVDDLKKTASDTWNNLGDAAKKAYEFAGKIWDAVKHFAHDNKGMIAGITIGLGVVAGIVSFFPPVGSVVAPICSALAGVVHLVEGSIKIQESAGILKNVNIPTNAKALASITTGLPNLAIGAALSVIGISDILTAGTSAVAGVGLVKAQAKKKMLDGVKTFGEKLTHAPIHKLEKVVKLVAPGVKNAKTIHGLAHGGLTVLSTVIALVGEYILPTIMSGLLTGISGLSKMVDFIMQTPGKISKMIEGLKGDTYVSGIIKKALTNFIKPFTDMLNNFLKKYIEPVVKPFINYFIDLAKNYKIAVKAIKDHHVVEGEHSEVKIEHQHSKPNPAKDIKLKPENKEGLKKAMKKVKVHESKNYQTFAEFALKN